MRQIWIQRRDFPSGVVTSEDIDARVMEAGEIVVSEKWTWMGSKIGKVVTVCSSIHQRHARSQRV
jgi:hypothetical protein